MKSPETNPNEAVNQQEILDEIKDSTVKTPNRSSRRKRKSETNLTKEGDLNMRLDFKELEENVSETIRSQAKISLSPAQIAREKDDKTKEMVPNVNNYNNPNWVISRYFRYIDLFNSITEFQTRVLGMDINQIEVLGEFKDFIYPRTVRTEPSLYWAKDLLPKLKASDDGLSYEEFIRIQNNIRRWFKKDAKSELVNLDSLKCHKALADVIPHANCKGKVIYDETAFIPIPLDSKALLSLYEVEYFNTDAKKVATQYISEMKF